MIFGKDYRVKAKEENLKRANIYKKMLPHKVFCFLPKQLENGQYVWLQSVYRFAGGFNESFMTYSYFYSLKWEDAIDKSRQYNKYRSYGESSKYAKEYLNVQGY